MSLGLWMEEMIFNLADSRLFFNDLEVRLHNIPPSEQSGTVPPPSVPTRYEQNYVYHSSVTEKYDDMFGLIKGQKASFH